MLCALGVSVRVPVETVGSTHVMVTLCALGATERSVVTVGSTHVIVTA